MKFLIVFAVAIACAVAAPPSQEAQVQTDNRANNPDGTWNSKLIIDNGIAEEQEGHVVILPGAQNATIQVKGSYTQLGPNGEPQVLSYVADENGYRATGPQVPVSA